MHHDINCIKWREIEGKIKGMLSQCLIKHYALRTYGVGGVEVYLHTFSVFLTLLLFCDERSATCPIHFTGCTNQIAG
jgi:hypothetical protein